MKRILLALLPIFLSTPIFAQDINWFPIGAEWYYTPHCMTEQHCGVVHFQVVADTLIAGKSAKKITREQTAWSPTLSEGVSEPEFLRFENDTVFRFSPEANIWHFLYCFNAQPGDIWEIQNETYVGYGNDGEFGEPAPTFVVQVDSVVIQEIAGSDRRIVYTSAVGESTYHYIGHLVEGVGSIGLCFGLIGETVAQLLGGYMSYFNCYLRSGNLIYGSPASPCFSVGIDVLISVQISVQPNPTKDQITIQLAEGSFPNETSLALYDLNGRQLLNTTLTPGNNTHILDLRNFSSGMYVLQCTTPDQILWTGKIVKE